MNISNKRFLGKEEIIEYLKHKKDIIIDMNVISDLLQSMNSNNDDLVSMLD